MLIILMLNKHCTVYGIVNNNANCNCYLRDYIVKESFNEVFRTFFTVTYLIELYIFISCSKCI